MSVTATEAGIEITRVFDAPRSAVFEAWTQPQHLSVWFGTREADVPLGEIEMDVRPGGTWRAAMYVGPDRQQIPWHGEYREVVPPERLVFTLADRPGDESELCTVELRDTGDGRTEMRFSQTGGHMDAGGYEQAAAGWNGFFDVMADVLR